MKLSVSIKAKNRETGKELERIVLAAGGFQAHTGNERPDLLVFEVGEASDSEFKMLESLLLADAVGEVFVVSDRQDTNLLLQAMRSGAKEFLSVPLNPLEVKTALAAFRNRLQQSGRKEPIRHGKIFHVCGAKGGVGTTTVAVNLAMILSEVKGAGSVALVDLNTVFGEIPLFLSIQPTYHWGQIAKNLNRLDSTFLLNAMARHASGVHILPSPSYLNGHPPATPEVMERLLGTMKETFDFIIVDGGQALDGPALKVIEMADQIFLVTLLSLPCLRNTKNLLKSLAGMQGGRAERLRLVINRHLKKSDISIEEAEKSINTKVFWNIPNDYKTTMSAINRGVPLHGIAPKAEITRSLNDLADAVLGPAAARTEKKSWSLFKR